MHAVAVPSFTPKIEISSELFCDFDAADVSGMFLSTILGRCHRDGQSQTATFQGRRSRTTPSGHEVNEPFKDDPGRPYKQADAGLLHQTTTTTSYHKHKHYY
jgi:hypothetical protein